MSQVERLVPVVEVLCWSGCPSTGELVERLRPLLEEAGIDGQGVTLREIRTDEEAAAEGFVGSPTLRIDGEDVIPPGPDDVPALTCRVYRRRDGRVSPTPDPEDIRDALRAASAARSAATHPTTPSSPGTANA
jgi:hypothetical protein